MRTPMIRLRTLAGAAVLGAVQCRPSPAMPLEAPDASIPPADASAASDGAIVTTGRVTLDGPGVVHVDSPVSGRIAKVDVALGDPVTKGQELAVIRSRDDDPWAWGDVHKAQA